MGRLAILAGAAALAAALTVAARAQTPPSPTLLPDPQAPTSVEGVTVAAPGVLFISPAGEPFRGGRDMTLSMRQWFDQADADHDGALSPAEFLADHVRFFKLMDERGDGDIDGFDVTRYEHEIVPELIADYEHTSARRPGPKGAAAAKPPRFLFGTPQPERQGAAAYGLLNEAQPLRIADADFDFHITPQEWANQARKRFSELDVNRDGRITFDELKLPPDPWDYTEPSDFNKCPFWAYLPEPIEMSRGRAWRGIGMAALLAAGLGGCGERIAPDPAAAVTKAYGSVATADRTALRLAHLKAYLLIAEQQSEPNAAAALAGQGVLEVYDAQPGGFEGLGLDESLLRAAAAHGTQADLKAALAALTAAQAKAGGDAVSVVRAMTGLADGLYAASLNGGGLDPLEYQHSLGAALSAADLAAASTDRRLVKARPDLDKMITLWGPAGAVDQPKPAEAIDAQTVRIIADLS